MPFKELADDYFTKKVDNTDNSPLALSPLERCHYLEDLEAAGSRVIADLEAGRRPRDSRFSSRIFQLLTKTPRQRY